LAKDQRYPGLVERLIEVLVEFRKHLDAEIDPPHERRATSGPAAQRRTPRMSRIWAKRVRRRIGHDRRVTASGKVPATSLK
jgi:hypothetical protein